MNRILANKIRIITYLVLVIAAIVASSLVWNYLQKKYYRYGADNVHSEQAIENSLQKLFGEKFSISKKECITKKVSSGYKFTVHYEMFDSSGLQFDAYEYSYGIASNSGASNPEDYYLVRQNLGAKRIENALKGSFDLSPYISWEKLADSEYADEFTVIYDGGDAEEAAELIYQIYTANREISKNDIAYCEVRNSDGKELYRYAYSSLTSELEKKNIDPEDRDAVREYLKEEIFNADW